MQNTLAPRGDASTFLTHFVGGGLDDESYVIQRYVSRANGEIVPADAGQPARKGKRRAGGVIVPLKAVEKLRPARDEIIIATGVERCGSQVQYWGYRALGIFTDRRQRG
ncbi:MAG: hypothetical protein OXC93_11165 [Rhodospirillaceae bacterium]|nr:hypothetical protein [Rhodospirillaceae bacterium]